MQPGGRPLQQLLSLQRQLPVPVVLAAANALIACSVPRAVGRAPAEGPQQASLHTAAGEGPQQGQSAAPETPGTASAASYGGRWQLRPFRTSAAASLAAEPPTKDPEAAAAAAARGGVNGAVTSAGGGAAEEEGEEEGLDEEASEHIHKAFEDLIQAAYELVQEGKPMEAEYILREGAKSAEQILGEGSAEVASLYDQLAMIAFFHDRVEEAKEPALRAYEILRDNEGEESPATAIAGVRYGILLLATGEPKQAAEYFGGAQAVLAASLDFLRSVDSSEVEDAESLALAAAKFEVGLGEARYYKALAELAQGPKTPEDVRAAEEELVGGIAIMGERLGKEQPLVGAAFREHYRLVEQALEADDLDAAEALYQQQIRLHEAYDAESEHVAQLGYQAATLQYVMGKYAEAAATLESALSLLRNNFEDVEDYLLTVKHRLGMAYGAMGEHERARAMLQDVAGPLVEKLGEDNPITHELNFMLALMARREAAEPAERERLIGEMQAAIGKLGSYGEEHMLVNKARQQLEEVQAAA